MKNFLTEALRKSSSKALKLSDKWEEESSDIEINDEKDFNEEQLKYTRDNSLERFSTRRKMRIF